MRVRIGDETWSGRAIDLRDAGVPPETVAAAVRGRSHGDGSRDGPDDCSVTCPDPGPVHEFVGFVRPDSAFSLRPALAAAARSRGHAAPQDAEFAEHRDRLDESDPPAVDLSSARRRVAEASGTEAEARERVATLQGRVQALRETVADADASDAEAELADATRRLADLETERIAAEQALARARKRARTNRTNRRERLRLRDRADNLRRAARDHLADAVRERFETACETVPGGADADVHTDASAAATDSVGAALAVARVADLNAPVVLAKGGARFESAAAAAEWLGAPVVRA